MGCGIVSDKPHLYNVAGVSFTSIIVCSYVWEQDINVLPCSELYGDVVCKLHSCSSSTRQLCKTSVIRYQILIVSF